MPKKTSFRAITLFLSLLLIYWYFFSKDSGSVSEKAKSDQGVKSSREQKQDHTVEPIDKKEKKSSIKKVVKRPSPIKKEKGPVSKKPKLVTNDSSSRSHLFNKQHKTEVFFKLFKNYAIFGGDQIAGAVDKDASLDENKYYKTALEPTSVWPNGVLPFALSKELGPELTDKIMWAVDYFNYETDIRFKPYEQDYDSDAILFTYDEDLPCSSYVGRVGGVQPIYLNASCSRQSIIHEIMHALGFVHEQQLPERSKHIEILWPNIQEEFWFNYSMVPETMTELYKGSEFEFSLNSVMMYEDTAFALPGKKSMRSLSDAKINPVKDGLSKVDKERLDLLY